MRISEFEQVEIKRFAIAIFGDGATVRLFGSRAYDNLRCGDIDLYNISKLTEVIQECGKHLSVLSRKSIDMWE